MEPLLQPLSPQLTGAFCPTSPPPRRGESARSSAPSVGVAVRLRGTTRAQNQVDSHLLGPH